MQVFRKLQPIKHLFPGIVLTMGNFDGLHLGHQAILNRVKALAKNVNGTPAVFTFESHPLCLLNPVACPSQLTTLQERLALFDQAGMELVICIPFTIALANLTADEFLDRVIEEHIQPQQLVVGHDFAFGKDRQGNINLLRQRQSRYGYEVSQVEAVRLEGEVVSSTLIRQKIAAGDVVQANRLLGRPYTISAQVVEGQQRGAKLGFPTANLDKLTKLVPGRGVYAVMLERAGQIYPGVANIGYQPTFGGKELGVEVHILDFQGNIYGESLTLAFIARLRDERAFADIAGLKAQIAQDCIQARKLV